MSERGQGPQLDVVMRFAALPARAGAGVILTMPSSAGTAQATQIAAAVAPVSGPLAEGGPRR